MHYTNLVLNGGQLLSFLVEPTRGFTGHYCSSSPLNLYVPYTEYIRLINDLIKLRLDILRTPLEVYEKAVSNGEYSKSMIRLYYYTIALSGLYELSESCKKEHECTRIFCMFDEEDEKGVTKLEFPQIPEFVLENFSDKERSELIKLIRKNNGVNVAKVHNQDIKGNINMYYTCLGYLGAYLYNKGVLLNIEGV